MHGIRKLTSEHLAGRHELPANVWLRNVYVAARAGGGSAGRDADLRAPHTGITLCGFAFGVLRGWLLGTLGCILGS